LTTKVPSTVPEVEADTFDAMLVVFSFIDDADDGDRTMSAA
jgi:hypothetical protein